MVEIVYLVWNRAEFTKRSLEALVDNTDWSCVERLVIYDDGSEDGADEIAQEMGKHAPVEFEFRRSNFRSPPLTMNDFIERSQAEQFVKIDSDICVPPGWLEAMTGVMEKNPPLELLGMEAGRGAPPQEHNEYTYVPSSHIGGVGLMRMHAFRQRPLYPIRGDGYQGFTQWQHRMRPKRGFIEPYLLCAALDRIPVDPWATLSTYYQERGWQRIAGNWRYAPEATHIWEWLEPAKAQA